MRSIWRLYSCLLHRIELHHIDPIWGLSGTSGDWVSENPLEQGDPTISASSRLSCTATSNILSQEGSILSWHPVLRVEDLSVSDLYVLVLTADERDICHDRTAKSWKSGCVLRSDPVLGWD